MNTYEKTIENIFAKGDAIMDKYVNKDIICAKMMHCNFRSPNMTVSDFINDELPTADVQPISYAERTVNVGLRSYCSNCGKLAHMENFCSWCGAKVKKG